jgi:hypothetical protein
VSFLSSSHVLNGAVVAELLLSVFFTSGFGTSLWRRARARLDCQGYCVWQGVNFGIKWAVKRALRAKFLQEMTGFPILKGFSMYTDVATGQKDAPLGQTIIKGQTDRILILLIGLEQL